MANMKRIRPNWLNMVILPNDSSGKRNADTPGKRWPSTDGPSTIPATISPMTVGLADLLKHPTEQAADN